MKKIFTIIALIAVAINISACSNGGGNNLIGTWDVRGMDGETITFYKDGSFDLKYYGSLEESGSYKKKNSNTLEITSEDSDKTAIMTYSLDEENKSISVSIER